MERRDRDFFFADRGLLCSRELWRREQETAGTRRLSHTGFSSDLEAFSG